MIQTFYPQRHLLQILRMLGITATCLLAGCSSVELDSYADNRPALRLEDFFQGTLVAEGIVKNRSGKVIRYFTATIEASWDESGVGTLDEAFLFDDGERQRRVWILTPDDSGDYRATAGDVVGTGQLRTAGNAAFFRYVLTVNYRERALNVAVTDRMFLVGKRTLISESVMTKFGLVVGTVTLSMHRLPEMVGTVGAER